MNPPPAPTPWSDVRAVLRELNATLDAVERLLKGGPASDLFSDLFTGFTHATP